MATKTEQARYTETSINVLKALTAIDRIVESFSPDNAEAMSKLMRGVNSQWNNRRATFDAKVKGAVESGACKLGDSDKGTGVLPVRAWRDENAAKPGRKAVVKTAAEKAAEALGISVEDLPADVVQALNAG